MKSHPCPFKNFPLFIKGLESGAHIPQNPFSNQVEVKNSQQNFIYDIAKSKFGGTITESNNEAVNKTKLGMGLHQCWTGIISVGVIRFVLQLLPITP